MDKTSVLRRLGKEIGESRDEEALRAEIVRIRDVQDYLLILAGMDPLAADEEVENDG